MLKSGGLKVCIPVISEFFADEPRHAVVLAQFREVTSLLA